MTDRDAVAERLTEVRRRLAQAMREAYETCGELAAVETVAREYTAEVLAPLLAHQRAVQAEATRLHGEFLALGGDPKDTSWDWPRRP